MISIPKSLLRVKELKSFLMRVKEKSERATLKLNIIKNKTKIMTTGPITSWQTKGEKAEVVMDFLFLGSQITQMVTAAMQSDDCFSARKLWQT